MRRYNSIFKNQYRIIVGDRFTMEIIASISHFHVWEWEQIFLPRIDVQRPQQYLLMGNYSLITYFLKTCINRKSKASFWLKYGTEEIRVNRFWKMLTYGCFSDLTEPGCS